MNAAETESLFRQIAFFADSEPQSNLSELITSVECVMTKAFGLAFIELSEKRAIDVFLTGSREEFFEVIQFFVWAFWINSRLSCLTSDVLFDCGHLFSEDFQAAEDLLLSWRWFDFVNPDA